MKQSEIENRWRMPLIAIARDLAAQGLSAKDAAKAVGMHYSRFQQIVKGRVVFDFSHRRTQISRDHKQEFWSLLAEIAETGANRKQAAEQLGYHHDRFRKMLGDNPDKDPFENSSVAARYLHESGQTVSAAAREFAALGLSCSEAARRIGYARIDGLKHALKIRGVEIQFGPRSKKPEAISLGVRITKEERAALPRLDSWQDITDKRYAKS